MYNKDIYIQSGSILWLGALHTANTVYRLNYRLKMLLRKDLFFKAVADINTGFLVTRNVFLTRCFQSFLNRTTHRLFPELFHV